MKKYLLLLLPSIALAHNVSSNIDIVPLEKIDFPPELKKQAMEYIKEQNVKGFTIADNSFTKKMYYMRTKKLSFAPSSDPEANELKKSLSDLPLTFAYTDKVPNPIAYTGIGLATDKGWSGVKTFFDGKELGTCSLSVFKISSKPHTVTMHKDAINYDVNDKPTSTDVLGSINSGFSYSVKWFDINFVRDLECTSLDYDKTMLSKVTALAKQLDY